MRKISRKECGALYQKEMMEKNNGGPARIVLLRYISMLYNSTKRDFVVKELSNASDQFFTITSLVDQDHLFAGFIVLIKECMNHKGDHCERYNTNCVRSRRVILVNRRDTTHLGGSGST